MRKYDESMPTPTDYSGLKIKVGIVISLLIFPFLWFYSVRALWEEEKDTVVVKIPAKVIEYTQFSNDFFLRIDFAQNGQSHGTASLRINPDDFGKYALDYPVEVVRNPYRRSADLRDEFVLFDEYESYRSKSRLGQWLVVLFPFALFIYYRIRTRSKVKPVSNL